MGTSSDALAAGSGQFGFSLLIEGYSYILTDAATTSAVVTAYSGAGWSQALAGLKVIGAVKQSIEPFKNDLDVPTLTFQVMDVDGNDTFAKAIWKSKPSIQTRLDAVFNPGAFGDGTVTVKDTTNFAASGAFYLGTRRVAYDSKTGTTFTVGTNGANTYSPFQASGSRHYSLPTKLAAGQNFDIAAPPRISDVPQTWHGKKVALFVHRILDGVWDVVGEAHLEFAGTIAEIEDGEGVTVLTCHDLRRQIEEAVLHTHQFTGYAKAGIYLNTGDRFRAREYTTSAGAITTTELVVVASGASGSYQLDAGYYDYEAFLAELSAWLLAEAATLAGDWAIYTKVTEQGIRTRIRANFSTTVARQISLETNSPHILEFMGFTEWDGDDDDDDADWLSVKSPIRYRNVAFINSQAPPYRIKALQRPRSQAGVRDQRSMTIEFDVAADGSWFNHSSYLPKGVQGTTDGENWSYVLIGERQLAVAEYSSTTKLINVHPMIGYGQIYPTTEVPDPIGVTYDDPADLRLPVRQVIYLTGKFSSLMPKLLASCGGTSGVNHATHDVFPWGAGVPWSLLGTTFTTSCEDLETAEQTDTIAIRMDRPTRLKDVLLPELALRFAFLIFKDGVYQFVSPETPSAVTADYTLNETNKAVGPGEMVPMSRAAWTKDYLHNVVEIAYERNSSGKFARHVAVRDTVSISTHGETEAITIDAVNSVSDRGSVSGSTVEALAANLSTRVFPMFGRPVKLITRSIAPTLYQMAPGDTVAISDDLVRDPTTGARGISGRAGIVLSTSHDYGHEGGRLQGEATILLTDEDRTFALSPAAEIDTTYTSGLYTNGYDSTNKRLKLKDNSFSKSSTDSKDVTNFDSGDLVRIVELDPADPASIDAWSRTLDGVDTSTGYLQMTATLSSPAYSGSTKKYVVIPQSYTSVQASQKLHAFQADDADAMILNTIEPNSYGTRKVRTYSESASTDLPALLADELYGDGKPLTPFQLQYLVRMANNLVSYKTAPSYVGCIGLDAGSSSHTTTATSYTLMAMFPVYIGGASMTGRTRYLSIAPVFRTTNAANAAYVKVVSSAGPPTGRSLTTPVYVGTTRSVEFTTTSTSQAQATAQDLLPVRCNIPEHTWISIQMKCSGGSTARLSHFNIFYLKPLE
jgi:hypothetical protein